MNLTHKVMTKSRFITGIAFLVMSLNCFGQAIKTDFDRKVIFTDSLDMPRNTTAATLITLLPELLQRPGNNILSNYDVQIEGMSVGSTLDVALNGLQIVDIEKIEVSESPLSSYNNNGQGGSINFQLRSSGKHDADRWGSLGMTIESPLSVSPQVNLGYRNDKFMVRGIALGEVHDITNDTHTITYPEGMSASQEYASRNMRLHTEMVRAYMQYALSDRDRLKFNISEIYTRQTTDDFSNFDDLSTLTQTKRNIDLHAFLRYEHNTRRGMLAAQLEYHHLPSDNNYEVRGKYAYESDNKGNNLSGKLEYKTIIFGSADATGSSRGSMAFGTNFNTTYNSETTYIDDARTGEYKVKLDPESDTRYLMPYFSMEATFGKLRVKASGEYQHFRYGYEHDSTPYSSISNDFTGKIITEWNFTPLRNLRLILDRKLQRPESAQLYPYRFFSPTRYEYVEGNPDLGPMMVHEVTLDYMGTYRWADRQQLVVNAGTSFSKISDIIVSSYPNSSSSGELGYVMNYATYKNSGENSVASANLMALYTYKSFSLSFTGNVYHKELDENSGDDHYTYYNLSIFPHFNLHDGWHGGARFAYYSRVNQRNGSLGDCAVADMVVGKAWNRFFIFLMEKVSIMRFSKDITHSGNVRTEKRYQMVPGYVGIGMKYSF